jgi:hypothetical protein
VRFRGTRPNKRVANLGNFLPKKQMFGFLGIVKGSLNRAFSVKYHKNIQLFLLFSLGWQPGYNRAGTCQ